MAPASRLLGETANSCASVVSVSACLEQHTGTIAGVITSEGESAKSINALILNDKTAKNLLQLHKDACLWEVT